MQQQRHKVRDENLQEHLFFLGDIEVLKDHCHEQREQDEVADTAHDMRTSQLVDTDHIEQASRG
jgi:hypothetical protein